MPAPVDAVLLKPPTTDGALLHTGRYGAMPPTAILTPRGWEIGRPDWRCVSAIVLAWHGRVVSFGCQWAETHKATAAKYQRDMAIMSAVRCILSKPSTLNAARLSLVCGLVGTPILLGPDRIEITLYALR